RGVQGAAGSGRLERQRRTGNARRGVAQVSGAWRVLRAARFAAAGLTKEGNAAEVRLRSEY
ncbi:MAG: hypothetical protein ACK55O_08765, partial [Phycisphaerales bacterium]